jgi:tetratricopeptide (TPR) repeat protein
MLAVTRKLLEVDPGNPRAFYLQAVLAARVGNIELARGLMNRTRNRLDGMPAATLLEGVLELQAGNYVLATEAFEELVREQPGNQRARLLLVRALYLSGEYKQLVIRFADDADAHDASPYLWTVLARSYEALGQRDRAAPLLDRAASVGTARADFRPAVVADADAEQARTDNPGNFDNQANAGDAQLAFGNAAAALESYRLAARIRLPESLMLRMVAAYGLVGQNDQAKALLETYLAENPRSDAAGRLAARYAADGGDWPRARLLLENLVANGADRDVRVLSELAVVQLRSGDAKAAEATARQAYRIQRSSPLAAEVWGLGLATTGERPYAARSLLAKAARFLGNSPLIAEARQQLARRRDG